MKTTTCSIPDEAGSGNAANEDVMRGESGPVGRQPSATAPAALAVLVKKVRRSMISGGYPRRDGGVRHNGPASRSCYQFVVLSRNGRFVAVVDVSPVVYWAYKIKGWVAFEIVFTNRTYATE